MADPSTRLWSYKRLWIGPVLGAVLSSASNHVLVGGWWSVFWIVVWGMAVGGLICWGSLMRKLDILSILNYGLCARTFGAVLHYKATVIIRPGGHPEVPGEVEVILPSEADDP